MAGEYFEQREQALLGQRYAAVYAAPAAEAARVINTAAET